MTELDIRREQAIEQYDNQPAPPAGLARLADWAQEARAATTLAEQLCETSFVPKHFFKKPAETAAAILTGHEMGMSPMASVRAIFVFNGTPGMYAKAMVAVVQSKGHNVWIVEQSDEKVVVRGQRKGSPHVFETTWDRARVVKAKLTGNAKYQESPQQMMTARGQAEICRQVAPDALFGIPYAVEEIEDFPAQEPLRAEVVAPKRVTMAELQTAAGESADEPDAPAVEMITAAQQKKLHATLGDLGLNKRAVGLQAISDILAREITTTNDLTKADAMTVIDTLEDRLHAERQQEMPLSGDDDE